MLKSLNRGISAPIAIIIIVVCAVLVGGIVVWQYYGMPEEEDETPEEKLPKDETADWKTYRNEEYGFEIKYPKDWNCAKDMVRSSVSSPPKMVFCSPKFYDPKGGCKTKRTEHVTSTLGEIRLFVFKTKGEKEKYCYGDIELKIINGIRIEVCNDGADAFWENASGSYYYHLYRNREEQYREIFNQMLSTFRFIEEDETAEPASSIKILSPQSPDGSLILINGSSVNIEWEAENIGSLGINIKLIYSTDRISNIVSNIPNTTKSYQWTIPQDIETGIYRISVGTNDRLEDWDLGSTYDISDRFIISPTTSIKPIINSVLPQEASIGLTIVIAGENFDPIGETATIGWATHSHVVVYMENSQGEKGILFAEVSPPTKNQITVTIDSEVCTVLPAANFCAPMSVTHGRYLLSISVDGRGTSNEVPISIQ